MKKYDCALLFLAIFAIGKKFQSFMNYWVENWSVIFETVQSNSGAQILKILDVPNPSGPKKVMIINRLNATSGDGDERFIRKNGKIIIERNGEEFELHKATRPANNETHKGF